MAKRTYPLIRDDNLGNVYSSNHGGSVSFYAEAGHDAEQFSIDVAGELWQRTANERLSERQAANRPW